MNPNKYFIYCRKSTDDAQRQVRSIADQLAEARELASREGLEIVDVLMEKQTAKRPGRPIFNTMLDRIEKGEACGILAWHPDRLSRNSVDGGKIIWLVDTGVIQGLKFPSFRFEPTPQGKLSLALEFGISKYYVDKLSEDIKRGQRQKVKNGLWPTIAPIGYVNDEKTRMIAPDVERAPLIRKMFELYATGTYTLDRLTVTMTELGLTNGRGIKFKDQPLSRAQLDRVIKNPIYYGTFNFSGEHHEGKHEPIITKALFDECQKVIERKSQPKVHSRLKPYLYRGIFHCGECGCFITTETQKGHNYLRCTKRVKKDCSQPCLREEKMTEQIATVLDAVIVPDDWTDWMIGELETKQKTEGEASEEAEQGVKKKIDDVTAKLDRLMVGYLAELFGPEEYREQKQRLLADKQELTEKLAALVKNRSARFEPEMRFVNALKQAKIAASSENVEEKRDFFKTVGSNPKLVNRTLRFVPRNAWQTVVDQEPVAQHSTAPSHLGAVTAGKPSHYLSLAERGRFELWGIFVFDSATWAFRGKSTPFSALEGPRSGKKLKP